MAKEKVTAEVVAMVKSNANIMAVIPVHFIYPDDELIDSMEGFSVQLRKIGPDGYLVPTVFDVESKHETYLFMPAKSFNDFCEVLGPL